MMLTPIVRCDIPADWAAHFSQCLYDWQTLTAGMLALLVGGLTIEFIRRQMRQQDDLHAANRRSRFAVAKAKAPLAAIEIANHARCYLDAALALLPLVLQRSSQSFQFQGPIFPTQAETILDGLVECTDDSVLIDQVSALYSEQQVMASRLSNVGQPSQHALTIDDYILQPLMMDAIAMNLLGFGRDGEDMQRLSWDQVERSAKRLLTDPAVEARILAYIADKRDRERPVPLALRRHHG